MMNNYYKNILVFLLVATLAYAPLSINVLYEIPEAEAGFRKVVILSNGTTSWTVPSDWNNSANVVEVIGGGGGAGDGGGEGTGGAGGGAYARSVNIGLTRGTVLSAPTNFDIGDAGVGGATNNASGTSGGDTWFNASSLANCVTLTNTICAAAEGGKLSAGNATTAGAGGLGSNSVGVTTFNGGTGGIGTGTGDLGGGGGGGAGKWGIGNTGGTGAGGGAGGSGDAGYGGAGGTGGTTNGNNGGNGAEWSNGTTAGSGGGGEGGADTAAGGNGGNYGGGGGGGEGNDVTDTGDGIGGVIVITYIPSGHVVRGGVKVRGLVRFR
ncbi:MAG: hypothetical protein AAB420_02095 [Patescibacteria group bacterium]